ncbi:MAG TPA: large conductance mechanosensitive channel protein MscL [Iamia sp.]|nr:large conductance mechanosensitive channel protein MscL [Iamia sp.]
MLKEFKDFIMKGNLLEVAVGLILALAFKSVVDSLVADVINQIVAGVLSAPDFSSLTIDLSSDDPNGAAIFYGRFINTVISFVIVGFILFLIVKAYNRMVELARRKGETEETPEDAADVILLREIRDLLAQGGGAPADPLTKP